MKTTTRIRAILFDVDGTLADTERDGHRPAFNAAFREAGLDWHWNEALYGELLTVTGGKERIRHYMEQHAPAGLERPDLSNWIAGLHKAKTRHYVTLLQQSAIPLRPGVVRLIDEARNAGVRLAIATTTTPENVTSLLESTLGKSSPGWFDVIGAGDIVPGKKPAPDIYDWVLQQLGVSATQCIAVEDSENGLRSAMAAGITTIVTVNDYTRLQNFSGASVVLSDLGEPSQPFTLITSSPYQTKHCQVDLAMLDSILNESH